MMCYNFNMLTQILVGILLLALGFVFAAQNVRPWIDYDFIIGWSGLLTLLNVLSKKLSKLSIFSNVPLLLQLLFASAFLWWFYEFINLFTKNWAYPKEHLYMPMEFAILASISITTILPLLILCTRIISGIYGKEVKWKSGSINKQTAGSFITIGILFLILSITHPVIFFPLTWGILALIFDPLNAFNHKKSLLVQIKNKNYQPLIILAISSLLAGFFWETMNHFIPKWTYPIEPWFWKLPSPITTKYIQMPLAGFIGYIPFIWSEFAVFEFLQIKIPWL